MIVSCLANADQPKKQLPFPGEVFVIEGRTAFLIQPDVKSPKEPVPWVWYAPTLRGLPGGAEKWMFERFLKAGIAIAGIDVGESYGSPKGRALYSALHRHLVEKRGMARQACLLARSRGGLMLYSWAAALRATGELGYWRNSSSKRALKAGCFALRTPANEVHESGEAN